MSVKEAKNEIAPVIMGKIARALICFAEYHERMDMNQQCEVRRNALSSVLSTNRVPFHTKSASFAVVRGSRLIFSNFRHGSIDVNKICHHDYVYTEMYY